MSSRPSAARERRRSDRPPSSSRMRSFSSRASRRPCRRSSSWLILAHSSSRSGILPSNRRHLRAAVNLWEADQERSNCFMLLAADAALDNLDAVQHFLVRDVAALTSIAPPLHKPIHLSSELLNDPRMWTNSFACHCVTHCVVGHSFNGAIPWHRACCSPPQPKAQAAHRRPLLTELFSRSGPLHPPS